MIGPSAAAFVSSQKRGAVARAIPMATVNPGASADLPGPAAGFLRFYDFILNTPSTMAAPMSLVTFELIDAFAVAWLAGTNTAPQATQQAQVGALSPLGAGEVFRVTNGGPNPLTISAVYFDRPATGYSLIRTALPVAPAAAQVLIPAPPAGFVSRVAEHPCNAFVTTAGVADTCRLIVRNGDTISHNLDYFVGGVTFGRAGAITATNIQLAMGGAPFRYPITPASGPLAARINEAIATAGRSVVALGAYLTTPG